MMLLFNLAFMSIDTLHNMWYNINLDCPKFIERRCGDAFYNDARRNGR